MLCDECQTFRGPHVHNAPYHSTVCECDGSDMHRRPVRDETVMLSVRLKDLTDASAEQGDAEHAPVYTGRDILPYAGIRRLLGQLWRD